MEQIEKHLKEIRALDSRIQSILIIRNTDDAHEKIAELKREQERKSLLSFLGWCYAKGYSMTQIYQNPDDIVEEYLGRN